MNLPRPSRAAFAAVPAACTTRRARTLLAGVTTALVLMVAGCSVETKSTDAGESGPKKREAARVRTAPIEVREMVRTLSTTTVVESEREILIIPRAAGVVMEIRCEEGDRVKAGAVLAVLDRRQTAALVAEARIAVLEAEDNVRKVDIQKSEAESRIQSAQMKHEQALRDHERNEKANLISAQALDGLRVARDMAKNELESLQLASQRSDVEARAARTMLEKARLALERALLDDSYMEITAPFDGVIASRGIRVGAAVGRMSGTSGPATGTFVLTDTANLRAVFFRPQRELALFLGAPRPQAEATATGAALEIRVLPEALPGTTFRGELQLVSPSIDPQSGSFRVTVRLGEAIEGPKGARLLPGMLVRLEIVTDRHPNALAVPKRALRREGEINLVFVVKDGRARKVEVTEGFSDDTMVELLSKSADALVAGTRVVVVGNRELEDGAEVQEEADAKLPLLAPPPAPAATSDTDTEAKKG